jgi:hypothetical protein
VPARFNASLATRSSATSCDGWSPDANATTRWNFEPRLILTFARMNSAPLEPRARFQGSLIMAHKLLLQPAARFRGARYFSVCRFDAKGEGDDGGPARHLACDLARSRVIVAARAPRSGTEGRPTDVVAQGRQKRLASRDAGTQGRRALAERRRADGRPSPPAGSFRCGEDAESRGTAAGLCRRRSDGTAWSLYGNGAETIWPRAAYSPET